MPLLGAPALSGLRGGLIPVTDAVDGAETVERAAKAAKSLPYFGNILVKRTATDIGMHAPDGMDETVSADDHARIGVQVIKDAKFFTTEFAASSRPEYQFQTLRMDFGAVEGKRGRRQVGVTRQANISGGFAATQDGFHPRD